MRQPAFYARVSSPQQAKEETIESQIDLILRYAAQKGDKIPSRLCFTDTPGRNDSLARPGLDRLRDAAAAGEFQVLYVQHIDRLARNLGAQYFLLNELERAGVEVIFLNEPDLPKSPELQLLRNVQGAFAEYERVLIQDRMRRGRLYRLRHGQAALTRAPYGYRFQSATPTQTSHWTVIPEEAAVVQQVFAWYTEGDQTLAELAGKLNDQGTPSPQGQAWSAGALGRLLRQPAYRGKAYYNRHHMDADILGQRRRQGQGVLRFPRRVPRPSEEWIAVDVPSLVDVATWQAAQERLAMNARFAQRNNRRTYLLRGLLVCGFCGHTLRGRTERGIIYYACVYGGEHCPPGVPRHTCSVRGDLVEPLIWQALGELLRDPQRIQRAWEAMHEAQATAPSQVTSWQKRLTLLRKQRERLHDAYQVGLMTWEELAKRQNPLDTEMQELDKRIQEASQGQSTAISLDLFTRRIEQALAAVDMETKQEVLRLLIERIVVTDEALTVEHVIPTVSNCRLDRACGRMKMPQQVEDSGVPNLFGLFSS